MPDAASSGGPWPSPRPGRWRWGGAPRVDSGRPATGEGRGVPRRLRPGVPAALHRRERGRLGRLDRRLRVPHRRPDPEGPGAQRVRRGPPGDRDRPGPAREQGRPRRPDRPPAREGPPPRGRGAGDDPRGGQGPDRGRGQAVGHPGRVHLHARTARQAGRAPLGQRDRQGPDRVARPRRAPGRLGDVQVDRRPAPRRAPEAPRPPEPGRPVGRVRLVLRAPGRRLRPDRRPDDRHLRRDRRDRPAALRAAPHLGQARPGEAVQRPRARGADPRPLAPEPLGPELAGAGRGGRRRRPLQGQDPRVHHRAGREVLRLDRLPEAPEVVLREVRPLPRRPEVRPEEELARLAPGTSTSATTSGA